MLGASHAPAPPRKPWKYNSEQSRGSDPAELTFQGGAQRTKHAVKTCCHKGPEKESVGLCKNTQEPRNSRKDSPEEMTFKLIWHQITHFGVASMEVNCASFF